MREITVHEFKKCRGIAPHAYMAEELAAGMQRVRQ
jgi:hypothetical protein